jgi:hypothetical protein
MDRSLNLKTKDDPAGLLTTEQKYRREQMALVLALSAAKNNNDFLGQMRAAGVALETAGVDAAEINSALELARFRMTSIRSAP